MTEVQVLPDGSAYTTISLPLPKDHWIYGDSQRPPMLFRMGKSDPRRKDWEARIRVAGQYAVRSATMNGRQDIDPDALLQNLVVGMLGYHTEDGLTSMGPEDAKLFDPYPVPPIWKG